MKAVGGFPHLHRHPNGKYYFRIAIPVDLQAILGVPSFKKSLRTSDLAAARQYSRVFSNRAEGAFSWVRKAISDKERYGSMSDEDFKAAVRSHFEKCLYDGEGKLYGATAFQRVTSFENHGAEVDPLVIRQEVKQIRDQSQTTLDHLRKLQADHFYSAPQEKVARELSQHFGLYAPEESSAFLKLCNMLVRAQTEAERIKLAYYSGNPAEGAIRDPLFDGCRNYFEDPYAGLDIDNSKPFISVVDHEVSISLQEAVDLYIKSRSIEGVSPKRVKDITSFMNKLVEYLGPDMPLSSISKKTHGHKICTSSDNFGHVA